MAGTTKIFAPFTVVATDTEAMPREDWLRERKLAVCGSDYPALVGLSGFQTAVDIYEDKIDPDAIESEITLADKYRFDIGHALESIMHEAIALDIGATAVRDKRMVESVLYPYMRVDIDGLFYITEDCVVCGFLFNKGDIVMYEGKTTQYSKFMDYRESPSPAHVAQCKFAMLVRGLTHCIIGYSCGGNNLSRDLAYHVVELTEEDRDTIPLVVKEFWEENVLALTPPSEALGPYASDFKKALIRHYGKTAKNDGEILRFPVHMQETLKQAMAVRGELSNLNAQIRLKEAERDTIDAPLIALLGDQYQNGVLESIYTSYKAGFSVSERETISADNMLRLQDEMPDEYKKLLAAGIITTSVTRTFSVRSKKKKARTQKRK
jgi:predicted phage-related endonuclease